MRINQPNHSPIRSELEDEDEDIWLQKSLERSERSDPDFDVSSIEQEPLTINLPNKLDFTKDRVLLVYESQLNTLLDKCQKCSSPIISRRERKLDGCQYRVKMECLDGCETIWCSQTTLKKIAGKTQFYFESFKKFM